MGWNRTESDATFGPSDTDHQIEHCLNTNDPEEAMREQERKKVEDKMRKSEFVLKVTSFLKDLSEFNLFLLPPPDLNLLQANIQF